MTQAEFISNIKQELSVACAVPISIKNEQITQIINLGAKWFYDNYEYATEEKYYVVPVTTFNLDGFKKSRSVPMPDCVMAITSVKVLRDNFSSRLQFDGTTDTDITRIMLKDVYSGVSYSDSLMYYTINLYWMDLASHILNHTISYNYNHVTKRLFIEGETPYKDVVVATYSQIPMEALYESQLFHRYVVAKAKIQASRVIGTFDFNLPGGIKINYDLVRDEGKEELEEVKTEIKDQTSNDFFYTTGGM